MKIFTRGDTMKDDGEIRTPLTDVLFARHCLEAEENFPKFKINGMIGANELAVRQVKELLAHARRLERDRARLREAALAVSSALHWEEERGFRMTNKLDAAWGKLTAILQETEDK